MFRDLLDFTGFSALALLSTLFFLLLFLGVVIRVAFLKPGYTTNMSALPLDGDAHPAHPPEDKP
jgi:hypothetical protein